MNIRPNATASASFASIAFANGANASFVFEGNLDLDVDVALTVAASLVFIVPALIVGWYAVRGRVLEVARERAGYTGEFPVVANRPPPKDKDE